jgi:hypothetical protein
MIFFCGDFNACRKDFKGSVVMKDTKLNSVKRKIVYNHSVNSRKRKKHQVEWPRCKIKNYNFGRN